MRQARTDLCTIRRSTGFGSFLLAAACGATDPPPPPPPSRPSIVIVSGNDQETVVGNSLAEPFVVRVFDTNGPRVGQLVVISGAASAELQSNAEGIASFHWRGDIRPGPRTFTASLSHGASVTFSARVSAGPPHSIYTVFREHARLGEAIKYPPQIAIIDTFLNRLPGLAVTFRVESGGGTIVDSVHVTDSEGMARLGGWTLGPSAPIQSLFVSVAGGLTGPIIAQAAPHSIAIVSGDSQLVNVGTYLKQPLVVRLFGPDGAPVGAGFPVAFNAPYLFDFEPRITTTDSTGTARTVRVQTREIPDTTAVAAQSFDQRVTFTLIPNVPTPRRLIPLTGIGRTTLAGNLFETQPSFQLVDSVGDPVGGEPQVTFTASNGGTVLAPTSTNGEGVGSIHTWRLGTTLGRQSLRAVHNGVELAGELTTTVIPAPTPSQFSIDVRFRDTLLADSARQAITDAANQWATAILGDLPDVPLDLPAEQYGCYPAMRETVDDLVIFVSVVRGDGPGGALAGAAPCLVREGTSLPLVSTIVIDEADLEFLGKFRMRWVALHEIGHALGFGTIWETRGLFRPPPSTDGYLGLGAAAAFSEAFYPVGMVPVERGGGAGTRFSHWANIFPDLMTGYLNVGNVLSTITLGAMRDLGYVVDDRKAEPFPAPALRVGPVRSEPLQEWVPQVPVRTVSRQGTLGPTPRSVTPSR